MTGNPAPRPPIAQLRQCSRCRLFFPASADIDPVELKGWWTCPICHAALTPDQSRAPDDTEVGA